MNWGELARVLIVCGFFALALLWIEMLVRYRRDYLIWNCGICLETGDEWQIRKCSDGKVELISGSERRLLKGWILPFDCEEP